MPDNIIGACWHCGQPLASPDYGRETLCRGCGKPTRCCRNCRDHAPGQPNDCREPQAEPVAAKDRANFCEWFVPAPPGTDAAGAEAPRSADALRSAAEALFAR